MFEITLRKKCPYSELFWSVFSRIPTEYGKILRISPYSVRMRENTDQNNSEYGHFLHSISNCFLLIFFVKDYRKAREIYEKSHEVGERIKDLFIQRKFYGTIELLTPPVC